MTRLPAQLREWLAGIGQGTALPSDAAETLAAALDRAGLGHGHGHGHGHGLSIQPAGDITETRIGRYVVMRPLGEGAAGAVYKVYDPTLQRFVALKVIHQQRLVDDGALSRFVAEARVTARLQHPSVLPVHEIGRLADGRVFFTMQEVRGHTFSAALRALHRQEPGAPSRRELVQILLRVAEAIACAHDQGIVHRDLKPDNVMVGDYGEVYVLDWGIAWLLSAAAPAPPEVQAQAQSLPPSTSQRLTGLGQAVGTPDYMAPEQAAGGALSVGPAADLYALGGILFEIFVGRPPVLGLADIEPHLSRSRGGIPPGLEDLLRRTLTPTPQSRFTDAGEFRKILRQWLDDQAHQAECSSIIEAAVELSEEAAALARAAEARRAEAALTLRPLPPWAPEAQRAGAWALQDEASDLEQRVRRLQEERVHLLRLALHLVPEHRDALSALTVLYRRRHAQAEARSEREAAAAAEHALRRHDRGRCRRYLSGEGALSLHAHPPGARARLLRWEGTRRRLQLTDLDTTLSLPITEHPLPRGSYVLELHAPGREVTRCLAAVTRGERWESIPPGEDAPAAVWMPPAGSLSAAERLVSAGWFIAGDPHAAGAPTPRRLWLESLSVLRHPITNAEYLAFLFDLWAAGREEEARAAQPQLPQGALVVAADGPRLRPGAERLPVVGVTLAGAAAYARWRGARDGLPWRLPGEWEWEKAARGVDGRRYPWGDHFSPTRCSMRDSRPRPALAPAGAHPLDCSPWQLRDMAGGVEEWCQTPFRPAPADGAAPGGGAGVADGAVVVRGGSWQSTARGCLLARRAAGLPGEALATRGFRLARSISWS